ncbi:MAG: hypothetical protein OXI33_11630 [Chloroflexota bacterium]|nr:hypothetical protein [Chloroflexota bacterium]
MAPRAGAEDRPEFALRVNAGALDGPRTGSQAVARVATAVPLRGSAAAWAKAPLRVLRGEDLVAASQCRQLVSTRPYLPYQASRSAEELIARPAGRTST